MAKDKWDVIRIAKQLPYIKENDIERMEKKETTVEDCYRIMKQRRYDW